MKLKFDYAQPIPFNQPPRDWVALSALYPRPQRRALLSGWLPRSLEPELYWLAEVAPEGCRSRMLGEELTRHFVALTGRSTSTSGSALQIVPFQMEGALGLLLGNRELHLFEDVEAEPQVMAIEGGEAFADARNREGQLAWYPLRSGHGAAGRVPVVFAAPDQGLGEGRHACLLDIDPAAGRARWLGLDAEGLPPRTRHPDFAGLAEPHEVGLEGPEMSWTASPLILDCAWRPDEGWLLYVGGHSAAHHRFGLAPSVLGRHGPDLALQGGLFQAREDSFGRFCSSGDRLILSPLRKNGPGKGKQTLYRLDTGEEQALALPRGYTKQSLVEYGHGCAWLLEMAWGYPSATVSCCVESA